jgi:hypothetical protein
MGRKARLLKKLNVRLAPCSARGDAGGGVLEPESLAFDNMRLRFVRSEVRSCPCIRHEDVSHQDVPAAEMDQLFELLRASETPRRQSPVGARTRPRCTVCVGTCATTTRPLTGAGTTLRSGRSCAIATRASRSTAPLQTVPGSGPAGAGAH